MNDMVIKLRDVTKVYEMGTQEVHALRGVSIDVQRGEALAIMGPSGSGKSTLMNVIGCLDQPTSGQYLLDGEDVSQMSEDELADVRNRRVGFIFQSFNLLARTTAQENVQLPLVYAGTTLKMRRERATEVLRAVGLGERLDHMPNELSGGQQQRVAIARALVNRPSIILADEPTGNLDSKSGKEVMKILMELNREQSMTMILVTHDPRLTQYVSRVLKLFDGKIQGEEAGGLVTDEPVEAQEVTG
jgi:putative ABC transport system ATP-binding protein